MEIIKIRQDRIDMKSACAGIDPRRLSKAVWYNVIIKPFDVITTAIK